VVIEGESLGGDEVRHYRDNVAEEAQPKVREELSAAYARYASMDRKFGELIDSVDAKTTVVFTSDAGEMLGSHEMEGDDSFYEESARVPMAIRAPGLKASASDFLVSHVDVLPTLLGLSGEAPVAGIQGRDLSRGERPEFVFAEGRLGQRDEWRMLVLGMDKLVVDAAGDVMHMFNLAADPFELRDLARDPGAQLKRASLMAVMRSERSRLSDFRRR
jgi:choline-sulfatase